MKRLLSLTLFATAAACSASGPGGTAALHQANSTVPKLKFAVFGDVRPPFFGQIGGYPSDIIGGIFTLAQSSGAQFAVGTGDYMFALTEWGADAQADLLLQAEANFSGPVYHALGNHECATTTSSNCPKGDETGNMRVFMNRLTPSYATRPYWRVDYDTPRGKAKFLFTAANAWSAQQSQWLEQQLANPTAYTFAVRHEPPSDTSAPGVSPSEALLHAQPITLELLGHKHEYRRLDSLHVISGNGGAPLEYYTTVSYGFLMVEQLDDGNISVTEIEQSSGNPVDTWKVDASGASVP